MPRFFIDRPVFAWVIPILICLFGAISLTRLGIDSYPDIAPPQVTITATYPGANAATMESTVTQVIEQQLTGIDNLLYFNSVSNSNGTATITLSFATGTNPDIAEVQVQNKVALAQPLLPSEVTQEGVVVAKASPDILMFVGLESTNPSVDTARLSDIIASQIQPVIGRVNGVGNTFMLGSEYAVRIWLDPDKLQGYGTERNQGAECRVRDRFARRGSARQGPGFHRNGLRRHTVHVDPAVSRHHPAYEQRRQRGTSGRRRADRLRCAKLRHGCQV
jgi:multidrug efflux pump